MPELAINASAEQLTLGGFLIAGTLYVIGAGVRALFRTVSKGDPEV